MNTRRSGTAPDDLKETGMIRCIDRSESPASLTLSIFFAGVLCAALVAPSLVAAADAEIGKPAPDFTLTDTEGQKHNLSDYIGQKTGEAGETGSVVVLEWFNPDCPFIKKHHEKNKTMNELQAKYADEGVVWLAINSGAPGKQGAGLERNRKAREEYAMPFPVLIDEDGKVGRMYGARTTPHMFVIDAQGILRYEGAIDDNRDVYKLGETNHVDEVLAAVLAGKDVATAETRPYGCSVKYAD